LLRRTRISEPPSPRISPPLGHLGVSLCSGTLFERRILRCSLNASGTLFFPVAIRATFLLPSRGTLSLFQFLPSPPFLFHLLGGSFVSSVGFSSATPPLRGNTCVLSGRCFARHGDIHFTHISPPHAFTFRASFSYRNAFPIPFKEVVRHTTSCRITGPIVLPPTLPSLIDIESLFFTHFYSHSGCVIFFSGGCGFMKFFIL